MALPPAVPPLRGGEDSTRRSNWTRDLGHFDHLLGHGDVDDLERVLRLVHNLRHRSIEDLHHESEVAELLHGVLLDPLLWSEPTRCCSGDHSPDQQFDGETVKNKISQSTVQDVRGQNKTRLRDVTTEKKQTIQSTLPTAVIKTSLRTREKTVEFQQMHDIDKIVRRCCVETEEGLNGPKKMKPWQRRLRKRIWFSTSTESWTYQWTRSLLMLKTPDHVAQNATVMRKRSLIFLLMVLRGLLFKHRQLKTLQKVMTQKVKVSVAEQPRVLRRYARESRGAD